MRLNSLIVWTIISGLLPSHQLQLSSSIIPLLIVTKFWTKLACDIPGLYSTAQINSGFPQWSTISILHNWTAGTLTQQAANNRKKNSHSRYVVHKNRPLFGLLLSFQPNISVTRGYRLQHTTKGWLGEKKEELDTNKNKLYCGMVISKLYSYAKETWKHFCEFLTFVWGHSGSGVLLLSSEYCATMAPLGTLKRRESCTSYTSIRRWYCIFSYTTNMRICVAAHTCILYLEVNCGTKKSGWVNIIKLGGGSLIRVGSRSINCSWNITIVWSSPQKASLLKWEH